MFLAGDVAVKNGSIALALNHGYEIAKTIASRL
jgi:thioredoxin reductase